MCSFDVCLAEANAGRRPVATSWSSGALQSADKSLRSSHAFQPESDGRGS